MADLTSLNGIAAARETLYSKLEDGAITEMRARECERILRGQTQLKAEVPMKFMKMVMGFKGGKFEAFAATMAGELAEFIERPSKALKE